MRILVCVKYVPVLSALRFDPDPRRLVREGVPGEVSSFDLRALGAATALAKAHGGEVVALTMGPPAAREGLVECLALGADRAVHLLDPLLAGSDTLATSHALAGRPPPPPPPPVPPPRARPATPPRPRGLRGARAPPPPPGARCPPPPA